MLRLVVFVPATVPSLGMAAMTASVLRVLVLRMSVALGAAVGVRPSCDPRGARDRHPRVRIFRPRHHVRMADPVHAPQRVAVLADAPAISALMRDSVRDLFPHYYDERQTASAVAHVALLDIALIADGTYYVHEAGGEIVACGGWSRRNKLHAGKGDAPDDDRLLDPLTEPARVRAMFVRSDWTRRGLGRAILDACERAARAEGFTMLALMATLPGEPLYRACGFRETGRTMVVTPDGIALEGVAMERPIS